MIKISRSHPGLVEKLFHIEVPEIQDGIIKIKSISRDPGKRTKIAVHSTNDSVGAVGTCVGHMGGRIQAILREINNEKIDILEWNEDPAVFIGNSLKPATITEVVISNSDQREATVVVPDDQLSLAIGKSGQNVRLAVKLTNWKLDIISEADHKKATAPEEKSLEEKIKQTISESTEEAEDTPATESDSQESDLQEDVSLENDTSDETVIAVDSNETDDANDELKEESVSTEG